MQHWFLSGVIFNADVVLLSVLDSNDSLAYFWHTGCQVLEVPVLSKISSMPQSGLSLSHCCSMSHNQCLSLAFLLIEALTNFVSRAFVNLWEREGICWQILHSELKKGRKYIFCTVNALVTHNVFKISLSGLGSWMNKNATKSF